MKQLVMEDNERFSGCVMGSIMCLPEIAAGQFKNWDYGHALAYLWRRFGPPAWGSDSYKNLAAYVLETEMPGVCLEIMPHPSAKCSFGYLLREDIRRACIDEDCERRQSRTDVDEKKEKVRGPVIAALTKAMEELKRPTNVRDWHFNIERRIGDSELGSFTGDLAEYSEYAGYGITPDYFLKFKEVQPKV